MTSVLPTHLPAVLSLDLPWGLIVAIKTLVVLTIIPAGALILGYVFLLKMMGHMQSRLGPMEPGGFHGWFQLIGDGIKFIQKEDIIPAEADRRVFMAAPVVVLISTFLIYIVIPAGPRLVVEDLDVGIFYALAVGSLSVIGVLMAGWASANKYSLLGALRAAGQLIAYELPLVLAVVGVVIQAGTMSLQGIVNAQADGEIFGIGGMGNPSSSPRSSASCSSWPPPRPSSPRHPSTCPWPSRELVAGYMTEYSGFRFLFFFMAEFGTAFAFAAIAATLYLGGWSIPGVDGHAGRHPRAPRALRQDHAGRLPDLLGPLHVPPLPGGPAPGLRLEVPDPHLAAQHPGDRRPQGGGLMAKQEDPRPGQGSRRHVEDHAQARGHGAVPPRAGGPAHPGPGRHRPQGGELHGVHALRPGVPRLVHLHRGPQGEAPAPPGGRPQRTVNALDRFDIDYALCMYCGICVEVCPFDALFWSPEYEYSEPRIADLLHDKDKLGRVDGDGTRPRAARSRRRGQEEVGILLAEATGPEHRLLHDGRRHGRGRHRLVTTKNVVRAALSLAIVLAGVAGQYILLAAEFVGLGPGAGLHRGRVILFLFGVMLTRAPIGRRTPNSTTTSAWPPPPWPPSSSACWPSGSSPASAGRRSTWSTPAPTAAVADSIFRAYVIPFEVASVLLLAALVGAVVLARRD